MPRQTFQVRYEVKVPARGPIGPSSREQTFSFTLPDGFRVIRDGENFGAGITNINLEGLTERRRDFRSRDNGVELVWIRSNGEVFPFTGRKALMDVELIGETNERMAL